MTRKPAPSARMPAHLLKDLEKARGLVEELERAGDTYHTADQDLGKARKDLHRLIRMAKKRGLTVRTIAWAAGLSPARVGEIG